MTIEASDNKQAIKLTPKLMPVIMVEKKLSSILLGELQRRKRKNPNYSLRSFARDLRLSRTTLSDVINDKQGLSRENLNRISAILSMPVLLSMPVRAQESYYKLSEADERAMLSNWYYPAIFSLARLKHNRAAPEWISRRLGITPNQAKRALFCLIRLQLVQIRAERMIPLKDNFETATDVPSPSIRRCQRQFLKRAIESLESNVVSDRDIVSLTLAFGEKDMKRAKIYIRKFINRFCKKFEITNATDVYTLAVQLYPQTVRPK